MVQTVISHFANHYSLFTILMGKMRHSFYLCLFVLMVAACTGRRSDKELTGGDTLAFKYAENISVVGFRHFTVVELKNPWKPGQLLHRYILLNESESTTDYLDQLPEGTVIRSTPRRAVLFTTAHAALLQMLGQLDAVGGVCDLKYMLLPEVKTRVADGRMADCGDGMAPNVEKIIERKADVLLLSPFENSGGYGRLDKTGIPIIECADYMETSPLGRAEWMKFYGLLFGCKERADSLFAVVERNYLSLKKSARRARTSPSILTERITGSTWYVPGGRSTVAVMLRDAAARYPFAADTHSGSLALPFESVLENAGNADLWLIKYNAPRPLTYADLLAEYRGYKALRAFKNKQVFACNASVVPYFEETPFRPDLLLRDYVQLFHPEMRTKGALRYFTPLTR